jgi:TRAP-type uncharacterized transport system substrate-binding protein
MKVVRRQFGTPGARRVGLLVGVLVGLAALIATLDLPPNLAGVKLAILSGPEAGNYYALAARLAAGARNNGGHIENVATQGSGENVNRLVDARGACNFQFAIAQDRRSWPPGLTLVARLPKPETVFFLGRDADRIRNLADLRGLRIGIGPEDSGTAEVGKVFLADRDVVGLGLHASHHPLDEQLSLLERGALDLGVFVIDEDAHLIENAIRDRGLAIVSFPQAQALVQRYPRVRIGRIVAGHYDALQMLPPTDKTVFQIDPVIIGNSCARRSRTTGLLILLAREFPNLVQHNRDTRYRTDLPLNAASQQFFERGGPDFGTEYVPWLTDLIPFSNWLYAITAISIIINLMNVWCRFGLSRIDGKRVNAEARLAALFRPGITASEITRLVPTSEHRTAWHRAELADLIATLEALRERCLKESMSWSSDWGEEMKYRYQERLMTELLDALRGFQARVDDSGADRTLHSR